MNQKIDFNDFANEYDAINNDIGGIFATDKAYFQTYKTKIVKNILNTSPKRILDFGCGVGRNLDSLVESFKETQICGYDISDKSIEVAKSRFNNIDFYSGDNYSAMGKFDLIFVSNVFHHIPLNERANAVKILNQLLEDDGNIIVFEHNPKNFITRRIVDKCPYDKDAILLQRKELGKHFINEGFNISLQRYTLFFPSFLRFLWRFEKFIGFIPLGGQYFIKFVKEQ